MQCASLTLFAFALAGQDSAPEMELSQEAPSERLFIDKQHVRDTYSVTLENDAFTGSDNNYTNGFALSWLAGPVNERPEWAACRTWANIWSFLPMFMDGDGVSFVSISVGQEMYTPEVITNPNPPETSQPYAGVLFADMSFAEKLPGYCHVWTIRAGLVGPSSQADNFQETVHKWIGAAQPQGWSTQLPDEPILNAEYSIAYEQIYRAKSEYIPEWRLVPVGGLSLGNYFTGASGAVYFESGWNLPAAVGAITPRRGVDPLALVDASQPSASSFSAFFGLDGFAVGHYLPLDGTIFSDSRSVDSEPFLGFASAGVSYRYGAFAVNFLLSKFTKAYATEETRGDFGTLTLSYSI
ncbi:MAG: lipid A 3-O-deacylase [Planctomycetota bacterium]|jgi:lipid A 3-O-deacylase